MIVSSIENLHHLWYNDGDNLNMKEIFMREIDFINNPIKVILKKIN